MSSLTFDIISEFSKPEFEDFKNARKQPFKWAMFDFSWRRARYGRRIPQKKGRDLFLWHKRGLESGQAPNLFFDPAFYVTKLSKNILPEGKTPLEFYLLKGLSGIAPHWLFSEKDYFSFNQDLSKENFTFDLTEFTKRSAQENPLFLNGYDHFCLEGDKAGKRPHRLFHPDFFRQNLEKSLSSYELSEDMGAWTFFLSHFEAEITQLRTSWYFDPQWYLQTYPEVAEAIEKKKFSSPLHHYLANKTPSKFDPLPYFSEAEYLSHHPDVQGAIDTGSFRNAYDHFLICGQEEGRTFLTDKNFYPRNIFHFVEKSPEAEVEMKSLKADDLFSLYVAYQTLGKDLETLPKSSKNLQREPESSLEDSGQIMRLSQARQEALFSVLSRSPLQIFTESWDENFGNKKLCLSVVLFSYGDYAALISSIESLAPILKQGTELLIVTSGNIEEAQTVRTLVKGEMRFCNLLKREDILNFWHKALETVRGDVTLWLEAGMRLSSENFKIMLLRLEAEEVSAFGGMVKEGMHYFLGGNVAIDGTLSFQAMTSENREYLFQGEAEIDLPASGMLLFEVSAVKGIWQKIIEVQKIKDRIVWTGLSDFESIALSLRESGKKILFSPSFFAHAEGKLSFPTRESHLGRWRRKMFPKLLVSGKLEKITFVLQKLPDIGTSLWAEKFICQIKSLVSAGFSIHLCALEKHKTDILERFLHFGSKISWEEASENKDLLLLKSLENSDLTWIAGVQPLKAFLSFWQNHLGETHALSPCLLDLRFEENLMIWDKEILTEIEKNPLIDNVALNQEGELPILDKFPELDQIILSLPQCEGDKIAQVEIEKIRFIFDRSRQFAAENTVEKAAFLELEQHARAMPRRPLKLLGD